MQITETVLLLYCRAGYESDLAAECEDKAAKAGTYGYSKLTSGDGFLRFFTPAPEKLPQVSGLIFARQKLRYICDVSFANKHDRIASVIDQLDRVEKIHFGNLLVEYPDTEAGKSLARFCRKFTVPLRNQLRKQGFLATTNDPNVPAFHLFVTSFERAMICASIPGDSSDLLQGILRLKFPSDAPSRSTLKLDEAILSFFDESARAKLFQSGMSAVDLGACPGGWTYQLVKRGFRVEAVDNGDIDPALMATGQVEHFRLDGFSYQPRHKKVNWLVCDMIENPKRVAELMQRWLLSNLADAALFNLKLPMKQRYQTCAQLLESLQSALADVSLVTIYAAHLYHDRDEITVAIVKLDKFK